MFANFRRAFGAVKVRETDLEIFVEGIPADVIQRDLQKVWRTSKIATHMLNTLGRSSFSFYKFFAMDIVFILDTLIASRSGVSVRVLTSIRDELYKNTWLKDTLPSPDNPGVLNYRLMKRLKKSPLPHQREYMEAYDRDVTRLKLRGHLAAMAAGSGKTITALMIAEARASDYILVIFPKAATNDPWRKTIENEYVTPPSYWMVSDGKPYAGQRIILAHYEAMVKVIDLVKTGKLKSDKISIILDESHNLNDIKSQRTRQWIELCRLTNSFNVFPMSGTPVKAMGAELIPLLTVLDPMFTPEVEARFKKIFGISGARGLEILKNRLGLISYTVEKKELGLDKPIMKPLLIKMPTGNQYTLSAIKKVMEGFVHERVKYYAGRRKEDEAFWAKCLKIHEEALKSKSQRQEYQTYTSTLKQVIRNPDTRFMGEEITYTNLYERRHIEPNLPREMIKQFRDVKSVIKYVKLKIQGECLGRVLGRKRIECHVDMVKHIDFNTIVETTMKKTLVFTSFVEALVAGAEHCKALGLKPLVVYGKTNNELATIVKSFEKDEAANPLIATYNSLSTAVPLTMADVMIMVNAPFRAYIEEQAISRIHRIGADTQTTIYRCNLDTGSEPNISTRSTEILEWSQQMVEEITGVKSPFVLGASLEDIEKDIEDFDDHRLFTRLLNSHYSKFGIELEMESLEDILSHPTPRYMSW